MPVEQIPLFLDNRFRLLAGGSRTALPRQQTLRAAIDWSYDLLTDAESTLLRRLSVFSGGWTLSAAEAVCAGDPVEAFDMLDLLTALSDKSLTVYSDQEGAGRHRLLESIREYGSDRLKEGAEEDMIREQHRAFFLALAEGAEPLYSGPDQAVWMDRMETEHDNLRAALAMARRF